MLASMHGEKFFRMCARLAIARPWLTLIVCLVLTVAAIYASTWMAINTRTESLFAWAFPASDKKEAETNATAIRRFVSLTP